MYDRQQAVRKLRGGVDKYGAGAPVGRISKSSALAGMMRGMTLYATRYEGWFFDLIGYTLWLTPIVLIVAFAIYFSRKK